MSNLGRCAGCGLEIAGGTDGCQALFDQFRLRESAELARDYASTRLTIDIYSVQHPDRYCVSAKSLAAHLTGLCWAVERGGSEPGLRALQRWLNGSVPLDKPDIPKDRGKLTVADIAPPTILRTSLRSIGGLVLRGRLTRRFTKSHSIGSTKPSPSEARRNCA